MLRAFRLAQDRSGNFIVIATALNKKQFRQLVLNGFRTRGRNRNSVGAIFGLGGGILAPLIGSIFTAISWFSGPIWHGFAVQRDGTVLLFLTIPLLIFGAHCLDLIDQQAEKARKLLSKLG